MCNIYYKRWKTLVNKERKGTRVENIVCEEWSENNPEGFNNFIKWLEPRMTKLHLTPDDCLLFRINKELPYTPTNTKVHKKANRVNFSPAALLTDRMVVLLRRKAKEWPRVPLNTLAKAVKLPDSVVAHAIRGTTYAHVDILESPFKGK